MQQKIVLIHIPKTAGTSLRAHLTASLSEMYGQQRRVIGVDGHYDGECPFEGLKQEANSLLPSLMRDGPQAMSGHFRYRDIADVVQLFRDQLALVTFVRDPIWRTISDYHFCLSEKHLSRDLFVSRFPRFEDYLANSFEMSKQFEYLAPFEGATIAETVQNAVENIDFVGVTEQFREDLEVILRASGFTLCEQAPSNVGSARAAMQQTYEEYRDQLEEVLEPELDLYRSLLRHKELGAWPRRAE